MLVQYLVGLYSLRGDPADEIVDVTIGGMVEDELAESKRDVDVTVTATTPDGLAFKGIEVKHHKSPLSVDDADGLINKLRDMPSVTHRAIVSTSGFSKTAITKAGKCGVDLYAITEWTKPLAEQFPGTGMDVIPGKTFGGHNSTLDWANCNYWLELVEGPPAFRIEPEGRLFDSSGTNHAAYPTFERYSAAMVTRSGEILCRMQPIQEHLGPEQEPRWSHSHTLDVSGDDIHLKIDETFYQLNTFTISGLLHWLTRPWLLRVLEKVPSGEVVAGAMIADSPIPGQMKVLVFWPDSRAVQVAFVQLEPNQLNSIRNLSIDLMDYANPASGD
jgi:hypothetical protein